MKHVKSGILLSTLLFGVSGCTSLPASGPSARAVESNATVKVSSVSSKSNQTAGIDYALVDINAAVLSAFSETTVKSFEGGFGGGRGGAPVLPLGVGDVVQVSIFESQAGGLFIPADAGSRPGNFVQLPQQTVGRSGSINIPYAGEIQVSGYTEEQVARVIEDRLANRAIEPQAVVTKISARSAQIAVLGDVRNPAKITLTEAGERVLDVLSEAGGLNSPGKETYVTLQRRGRSGTILYDHLVKTPAENIYVVPGDIITVDRERRTYLAFGAAGLNGRFDFEESDLSLGDALGKAGGLLDGRADPAQVMLYRVADKAILAKLGVNVSHFEADTVPVIFRANLRDPSSLFALQKFPMEDKDILYVTNSDSTELVKFLNIVNSVTSTAAGATSDVKSTRDTVRAF